MAGENGEGAPAPALETIQAQLAATNAELANAKARIAELSNETKGHRLNSDKHRSEAEAAAKARDEAMTAAERRVAEAEAKHAEMAKAAEAKAAEVTTKATQRAIRADLRIAAKDAGAVDVNDAIALLDMSKVKANAEGDVENAAELMAELKKTKPYLFGAGSTSTNPERPSPHQPDKKAAMQLSDAEYKAARERIARGIAP